MIYKSAGEDAINDLLGGKLMVDVLIRLLMCFN